MKLKEDSRAGDDATGAGGTTASSALRRARRWGRIEVLPAVVGALAAHAALGCYGVHAMAARGLRDGFAERLRRDNLHRGVDVREVEGGLAVDIFVVVQYGMRISEVARNLQEAVRFELQRSVGVPVAQVNVNVQGVNEP